MTNKAQNEPLLLDTIILYVRYIYFTPYLTDIQYCINIATYQYSYISTTTSSCSTIEKPDAMLAKLL